MKKNERLFVLDANVVVSASLAKGSTAYQALEKARSSGVILLSAPVLQEWSHVLARSKFDRYLSLQERRAFLKIIVQQAKLTPITQSIHACRDPKDNKFLELAVCGSAECIISGDADLLSLHPFRGIPVLTPAQFLRAG